MMRTLLKLSVMGFLVIFFVQPVFAASGTGLEPLAETAINHAEGQNFKAVKQDLKAFHEKWKTVRNDIRAKAPASYKVIESAYARAKAVVSTNNPKASEVENAVESLEKAVKGYANGARGSKSAAPGAKALLGYTGELEEAKESVADGNWDKARKEYGEFHEGWEAVEDTIRSADNKAYEQIETNIGLVSAALNANPPKTNQVKDTLSRLIQSIQQYANSKVSDSTNTQGNGKDIGTLVGILDKTQSAINAGNAKKAQSKMTEFISVWPTLEGQVKTRSAAAYTDTENKMTKALSLLSSNPPQMDQASSVVASMKVQLQPLTEQKSYSFWDAAIILLREGLEIILILAALLSFLNKTNNSEKRPWIWGGAGAGVLVSVGLAFVLTAALSTAAAGAERELLEGITGLIAVVIMFTVGAWLHNKSNIGSWNKYIKDKVGTALARGSLWSLAFVAFLTVVREGAETIIFYLGMAADISATQLTLGIIVALAVLLTLAFAIIKFSVKLPISGFFLVITVLIYYLAFKFTGQSVHAFQVADQLSVHPIGGFPSVGWLGIYSSWETTLAQALLLALILGQTWLARRRKAIARQVEEKEKTRKSLQGNR